MPVRIFLGVTGAAWLVYATYLLTATASAGEPSLAAPARSVVLAVLTAAVIVAAVATILEPIRRQLDQLTGDVADYGDRREILGHEIASRAYTSQRNGLRSVDA